MNHPRSKPPGAPTVFTDVRARLRAVGVAGLTDTERIDAIRELEAVKNTASATQARLAVDFDTSQRDAQRAAGVPAARLGQGVAAQVALARRESPHRGQTLLGLAKALVHELPHTMHALSAGVLSEYRAILITRDTACLTREDRTRVDELVCADLQRVGGLGNRELTAEVNRHAYRLDPHSIVRRNEKAVQDRNVTLRPAPEGMSHLGALLPVAQGVACYAALKQAADSARAAGDQRSRGQVLADTLTTRVTGQDTPEAVPVGVHVVMTDRALLQGDPTPAEIVGHGPVPAGVARALIGCADPTASFVRRLYTDDGGTLAAMESRSRCFPDGLATFIQLRDRTCRTPWCDAPIRHTDHATTIAAGGDTTAANGQGLCEACNYTKQAPGWQHTTEAHPNPECDPDDPDESSERGHPVQTVRHVQTPTGQQYAVIDPPPWPTSRPPDEPARQPPR